MKAKEQRKQLRDLSMDELKAKLTAERQALFDIRFQHATAQLEKTASIPATRKNIARILTILKELTPTQAASRGA